MTADPTPVDIAMAFLQAWSRRDLPALAGYLAEDVVFESPMVRLTGSGPFIEAADQFAQVVTGINVIAAFGDGDRAMVMYDMETGPFGTLRAVEQLDVKQGRITHDRLVFDTYEVRRAQ